MIPNSTGFLPPTSFISAQSPVEMFTGTPNGQSWVKIQNI